MIATPPYTPSKGSNTDVLPMVGGSSTPLTPPPSISKDVLTDKAQTVSIVNCEDVFNENPADKALGAKDLSSILQKLSIKELPVVSEISASEALVVKDIVTVEVKEILTNETPAATEEQSGKEFPATENISSDETPITKEDVKERSEDASKVSSEDVSKKTIVNETLVVEEASLTEKASSAKETSSPEDAQTVKGEQSIKESAAKGTSVEKIPADKALAVKEVPNEEVEDVYVIKLREQREALKKIYPASEEVRTAEVEDVYVTKLRELREALNKVYLDVEKKSPASEEVRTAEAHSAVKPVLAAEADREAPIIEEVPAAKEELAVEEIVAVETEEIPTTSLSRPPSPPPPPAEVIIDDYEPTFVSAATIASKLRIRAWTCRARKKDGGPCGWYSTLQSYTKKNEILDLVEDLSLIDSFSPAFDTALESLALAYTCHHHDHGDPLEERLIQWKNLLVPATDIRGRIHAILWRVTVQCSQCSHSIGGQKVQNCRKTAKLILDHNGSVQDYQYLLRVWDANSRCSYHSGWTDEVRVTAMFSKIKAIVPISRTSPTMFGAIHSFWPSAPLTTAFESTRRWVDPTGHVDSLQVLKSQATATLVGRDFDSGIVYIYAVDGNPGLLKIGYTGRSLQTRQSEIEFDCNRKCRIVCYRNVPNAKRVEAMCHADLHDNRLQVFCSGCLTNHNEWFKVSEETAQTVLDKWAAWMRLSPYSVRSLRNGARGYATNGMELRDIAAFKKDPVANGW